ASNSSFLERDEVVRSAHVRPKDGRFDPERGFPRWARRSQRSRDTLNVTPASLAYVLRRRGQLPRRRGAREFDPVRLSRRALACWPTALREIRPRRRVAYAWHLLGLGPGTHDVARLPPTALREIRPRRRVAYAWHLLGLGPGTRDV